MLIQVMLHYPRTSIMKMVRVLNLGRYQHAGNDEVCALSLNVLKGNPLGNAVKVDLDSCK